MEGECKWRQLPKPKYLSRWVDLKEGVVVIPGPADENCKTRIAAVLLGAC